MREAFAEGLFDALLDGLGFAEAVDPEGLH